MQSSAAPRDCADAELIATHADLAQLHIDDGGMQVCLKAGRATLTTVLSINALLEARIVTTRIQGPASVLHGAPALPDRIAASSHGGVMEAVDAFRVEGVLKL
jgi:hypothetical protein